MFLHTNLLGQRVIIDDDAENESIPDSFKGRTAVIRSVWIDPSTNTIYYTLTVQIPSETLRSVWNTTEASFGSIGK